MTLYDEYCYNLMEAAISAGVQGKGLTKDECVAYANIIYGAREVERYIQEHSRDERKELIEKMFKESAERTTRANAHQSWIVEAKGKNDKERKDTEDGKEMGD